MASEDTDYTNDTSLNVDLKKIEEEERAAAAKEQARVNAENAAKLQADFLADPTSVATKTDVSSINVNAAGTTIGSGVGQIAGDAPQVNAPDVFEAEKVDAVKSADAVAKATSSLEGASGSVSEDAKVDAQSTAPTDLASLSLDASQISKAQRVAPPSPRVIEKGELISGSAVDMAAVEAAIDVQAAQANPSARATVQGQLSNLMNDFDGSSPPAWAAGALRSATAQMAARGLGASSMAGQALIQAAMESALPIAMQDSSTFSKFEEQNLSNRQQTTMFAAEQRAQFLGMEFTQEFQSRVANASKISDIANLNFTSEQQIALENARMAQSVDITNLNASNAKVMADAAAMSQMDLANLNNRQQAAVQNAQSFLNMDMKNLDNKQQTAMFKAQSNIQAIFSDQSAENAAEQFNASSENQTNQFFATMATQVEQFNAGMKVQRDQFNASNALVVAQANAVWRQNAETVNTAAQNAANIEDAKTSNDLTASALDEIWQRERDVMDYNFRAEESKEDRAASVFLSDKSDDLEKFKIENAADAADDEGKSYLFTRLLFG